ncbi:MAG: hypothetical protein K2W85_00325 [Phycisphaerales bacterium]|nr:hypothetical protein [Phycisphaerales bacterium]
MRRRVGIDPGREEFTVPQCSITDLRRIPATLVPAALVLVAGLAFSAPALADSPSDTMKAKEQATKDASSLDDFVHYVFIDRGDVAQQVGQALLDRELDPAAFAKLVDSGVGAERFTRAVTRAQRSPGLEAVASKLAKLYDAGKLASIRDPDAISAAIAMLTGDMRQRSVGRERLLAAGEYAAPQLFTAMFAGNDAALAASARSVLVEMGRHSVMPLVTALPKLQPAQQEQVVKVLGEMPQTHALPFLYDLLGTTQNDSVKLATERAISQISGAVNAQMPVSDRYVDLALAYAKASPSLLTFPNDPNLLVWNFEPATGLTFQSVDAKVYPATMAMKLSELALRRDATNTRGVSTWIGSNFTRELRSPEGYENPVYPALGRDAMYYAVAAGPSIGQSVLAGALDSADTPLVRKALASLEKTGGRDLWTAPAGSGDRRPLLDALKYPNRRVQYEAALAIGSAQPKDAFPGAESVVRTLASSIRDAQAKYALIVAGTTEEQSSLSDQFRARGFTVLPPANNLQSAGQAIADAPGVDIIVSQLPSAATGELITQSLGDSRLRATPVLALVTTQGYLEQYPKFARDVRVRLLREGVNPKDIQAASDDLIAKASGGLISGDEAEMYKARSLGVLRDLAVSGSPVLNIMEAQGPLVTAMADAKGAVRNRIAEVLSYVNSKQAQVTLTDAALNAEGDESVVLLTFAAGSAKRYGNQLDQRQIDALVGLAGTATGEQAVAAAALLGALNIQNRSVVPLILGDDATK